MAIKYNKNMSRRVKNSTPKPPKVVAHSLLGPVKPVDIKIVSNRGTKNRGGGPGGESWIIYAEDKRAGTVFINYVNESIIGPHPSLQIFLNRISQGRRIGRVAYRLACESSQYDKIYAHTKKSNIPSWRAAKEAGFVDVTPLSYTQLILLWSRS